jgi:L-alanine-DL-glutamate epimerase-like enolase superfamily enzyme
MSAGAHAGSPVARLDALLFRVPCAPVRTSFGVMHDRPALLVRVEDEEGAVGWGEVWCNFPRCGAQHRAALLRTLVAPALQGQSANDPAAAWASLTQRFAVLALQCGEPGPLAQVLAAVDQALWDLAARRAGLPLWRLLVGRGADAPDDAACEVSVYASGIGPDDAVDTALAQRAAGHRAFKLKVGFDAQADAGRVASLRRELGAQAVLMVDANQGWRPEDATPHCQALAAHGLAWIEEPVPADQPAPVWRRLAAEAGAPLAAGENLIGQAAFDAAIADGALAVLQPDLAKWGGVSGCLAVARAAMAAGRRFCPHFLGAGIGLAMSAHVLAAVGGDGLLEMDVNPNPLRDLLTGGLSPVQAGRVRLPDVPGYGHPPDLAALRDCAVAS